jgi:hypothetical protein
MADSILSPDLPARPFWRGARGVLRGDNAQHCCLSDGDLQWEESPRRPEEERLTFARTSGAGSVCGRPYLLTLGDGPAPAGTAIAKLACEGAVIRQGWPLFFWMHPLFGYIHSQNYTTLVESVYYVSRETVVR